MDDESRGYVRMDNTETRVARFDAQKCFGPDNVLNNVVIARGTRTGTMNVNQNTRALILGNIMKDVSTRLGNIKPKLCIYVAKFRRVWMQLMDIRFCARKNKIRM